MAPLPAGLAFFYMRPERRLEIEPWTAGWKSREDPYEDYYGLPELTGDARRLDVSLPWFPAAGGRPSLELFASLGIERIAAHNFGLARALTDELGLPEPASPIVRLEVDDAEEAARRLQEAGVSCSLRGGSVRLGVPPLQRRGRCRAGRRCAGAPLRQISRGIRLIDVNR